MFQINEAIKHDNVPVSVAFQTTTNLRKIGEML